MSNASPVFRRARAALLALPLGALLALSVPQPAAARTAPEAAVADIPFEQFTLPNGLRVVVHTDRKAPIVAVNLWYHVGSKDEPAGRTGFAHLFEHLMFQSSENREGEYFTPFQLVGATDQNGTTNSDRTNYFQNVPTTALDMALWMESDRMGHLLGAVDQAALDEQRAVVQNEKRQSQNQPYGQAWEVLDSHLYPHGHPYHHGVLGSMNDLDAATLEDVHQWFRAWYGPNNAVLVLAGDIDVETAREKVTRYFGHIPAGPTLAQPEVDVARRDQTTRSTLEDNVPQERIYRVWNVAQSGTADIEHLRLLGQVLGGSRSSRLDRRLMHEERLVDGIQVMVHGAQLGGQFMIVATVRDGVEPEHVEAVIEEELRTLVAQGPTAEELAKARTRLRGGFIRGIERIGGFGGKADVLAACTVFQGDPGCFRDSQRWIATATVDDLRASAGRWLSAGDHVLTVVPGEATVIPEPPAVTPEPFNLPAPDPHYTTTESAVDRSLGLPMPDEFPELKFPDLQRAALDNGIQVILAERHEVPVVQFAFLFGGGFSADQGRRLGTSGFTMGMLDEGAGELGALEFADRADSLGASLGARALLDSSLVSLSALKENLDPSLALFADMVRNPRFDQSEIDRVKATTLAGIRHEQANPGALAMRVLPQLLYGEGHPYAIPFTGSGTEASTSALTREDLVAFHRDWVRPEGATLIVVGDTGIDEIVPLLERHFGQWRGEGEAPAIPQVGDVERPQASRMLLIDQPGAVQANLYAAQLVPSTRDPGAIDFDIASGVLGGDVTARLSMNLREDKGWSYGAYTRRVSALGPAPWWAHAPVQIDRTVDSLRELQREIGEYANGAVPPSAEEVERVRAQRIRRLPGSYETAASVRSEIYNLVLFDRPDDYMYQRRARIEAMTADEVAASAATIDPDTLTWLVIGDLATIEQPIRELEVGEVSVIDADGNPVAGD